MSYSCCRNARRPSRLDEHEWSGYIKSQVIGEREDRGMRSRGPRAWKSGVSKSTTVFKADGASSLRLLCKWCALSATACDETRQLISSAGRPRCECQGDEIEVNLERLQFQSQWLHTKHSDRNSLHLGCRQADALNRKDRGNSTETVARRVDVQAMKRTMVWV